MEEPKLSHIFYTIRGIRIHYVTAGNKKNPALILLAGFPESWYAWRKVIPLVAKSYWTVAIDIPGQGDSDKPSRGYDTQGLADTVHELVKALNLSHYFLAAHDIGAWVAFPYAIMFGQEVKRMALLDAGIPGITLSENLSVSPEDAWKTWHFAFHTIPDLPELLVGGRERTYLRWFLCRKTANPLSFTEADIDEYERTLTLPGGLRAGLEYYRACPQSSEQNKALINIGQLLVPILAISASEGSIRDMAQPIRRFARHVESAVIEECGHYIPEEQPEALFRVLTAFFGVP